MRFCARSAVLRHGAISIAVVLALLAGCRQEAVGHGIRIMQIAIHQGYRALDVRLAEQLELSQKAREALRNGVTLTFKLELELHSGKNLIAIKRVGRLFQLRYLPLSQRYQLVSGVPPTLKTYSRLRYAVAQLDTLDVKFPSGPLPPGDYELRARIRLDQSRLPAPMQLPAWFSAQWRHDSGWSVWPFTVDA